MQKIEYGDVNRFLVSMGIILIGLSILAPYFYLKEDFGIFLEQSQIEKLQAPLKEIIETKKI